jgi:hypothetical protein
MICDKFIEARIHEDSQSLLVYNKLGADEFVQCNLIVESISAEIFHTTSSLVHPGTDAWSVSVVSFNW